MICLFLAMLELVKLQALGLTQTGAVRRYRPEAAERIRSGVCAGRDHRRDGGRVSLSVEEMEVTELPDRAQPEEQAAEIGSAEIGQDDAGSRRFWRPIVYVTDEPLSAQQMAAALAQSTR